MVYFWVIQGGIYFARGEYAAGLFCRNVIKPPPILLGMATPHCTTTEHKENSLIFNFNAGTSSQHKENPYLANDFLLLGIVPTVYTLLHSQNLLMSSHRGSLSSYIQCYVLPPGLLTDRLRSCSFLVCVLFLLGLCWVAGRQTAFLMCVLFLLGQLGCWQTGCLVSPASHCHNASAPQTEVLDYCT